jgi:hypothetical protein
MSPRSHQGNLRPVGLRLGLAVLRWLPASVAGPTATACAQEAGRQLVAHLERRERDA